MIIVKLMGGMGNQMFQYALGRSLAIKHKVPLKLDLTFLLDRTPQENFVFRDYDLSIFKCQPEVASLEEINSVFGNKIYSNKHFNKLLPVKYRQYYTERFFNYDDNIDKLGKNVYLEGYWQSSKYFTNVEDIIRNDFCFSHQFNEKEEVLNRNIMTTNSVCVNVRRADFLTNTHHGVCNEDYFKNGLNQIEKSESDLEIFVFSDDMDWCRNNLKFKYKTTYVGHEYAGNKFESYLQLMTNCKHFIIPNSSFGWWAAWLAKNKGKIIITPQKWFNAENRNTDDLIPYNWIRL